MYAMPYVRNALTLITSYRTVRLESRLRDFSMINVKKMSGIISGVILVSIPI